MPQLLIIADLGHASPRFPGICQALGALGWEIDLITPRLSEGQKSLFLFDEIRKWNLIETPFYLMRYKRYVNSSILIRGFFKFVWKTVDACRSILRIILSRNVYKHGNFDHSGWGKHVNKKLKTLTAEKKYDLIISSFSPITAHVVARDVSLKYNIPWIVDYRDLYSLNHTNPLGQKSIEFEVDLIQTAKALITVSESFAESQKKIYKGKIIVANNGFRELFPCSNKRLDGSLKVLYTGTIESEFQNLELFLNSVMEINKDKCLVVVTFVGSSCFDVRQYYSNLGRGIPNFIHLNGHVTREKSLTMQKSADLLLYLEWGNPKIDGVLLTKLYEYIASGSPIFRVGPNIQDEASKIFKKVGYANSLGTKKEIIDHLNSYILNKSIPNVRDDAAASYYSYASIALRLDKDLRRIIQNNPAILSTGA
jgi:hypothetical protein